MSLDLFVFALPGDDNQFPSKIVEQAFAPFAPDMGDGEFYLYLDGEPTSVLMSLRLGEVIDGFSVNRPPDKDWFPGFWDALYSVLRQTRSFCVVAGVRGSPMYCVANRDTLDELPAVMDADERACVVHSGADLAAALVS
ncbi:MAG TPA: hypothetical protein VGK90_02425 [Rhizomicrobium sp.]|jgi:hypothetical protein